MYRQRPHRISLLSFFARIGDKWGNKITSKRPHNGFYHGNGIMRLSKGRQIMLGGERIGNQYVPFIRVKPSATFAKIAQPIGLWHQRLGHVSNAAMIRAMYKNNLTKGLEVIFFKTR